MGEWMLGYIPVIRSATSPGLSSDSGAPFVWIDNFCQQPS